MSTRRPGDIQSRAPRPPVPHGRLGAAAGTAAVCLLAAGLHAAVGLGPAGLAVGGLYALAVPWLLLWALRRAGRTGLGPAGRVTGVRVVLIGGVAALAAEGTDSGRGLAVLVALATVALVLDAVDGVVARRTGTSSPFGARLDLEADAALILLLAVVAAGMFGPWVLAIGLMRYVFAAAAWAAPWLKEPLPPSTARKAVAAVQGIALTAAVSQVPPHGVSVAALAAALALLAWSFGRDVLWLCRRHGAAVRGA